LTSKIIPVRRVAFLNTRNQKPWTVAYEIGNHGKWVSEINFFDVSLLHFLNQFAQRSWFVDSLISLVSDNLLLKGGVVTTLLWWIWFRESETRTRDRQFILGGVFISFVALLIARTLTHLLPFRERPLHNPALHFNLPFGVNNNALIGWSSFPSDHAVLYFSLATCVYFLSRRAGVFAYCHAFFIICLPRMYMGFHHPTDILAGALLGVGITQLLKMEDLRSLLTRAPMRWLDRSPAYFYPCFYLTSFLTATNFDPLRLIFIFCWETARAVVRHPH
jgi:undecaprenyl-diphosphatase